MFERPVPQPPGWAIVFPGIDIKKIIGTDNPIRDITRFLSFSHNYRLAHDLTQNAIIIATINPLMAPRVRA